MGFFFRKFKNLGPFRINLSKSGVGWSVGTRGARVGRSARGKKTTHLSIPGTGIGYRSQRGGCLVMVALLPLGSLLGWGIRAVAGGDAPIVESVALADVADR